jgi:hypothetical protein
VRRRCASVTTRDASVKNGRSQRTNYQRLYDAGGDGQEVIDERSKPVIIIFTSSFLLPFFVRSFDRSSPFSFFLLVFFLVSFSFSFSTAFCVGSAEELDTQLSFVLRTSTRTLPRAWICTTRHSSSRHRRARHTHCKVPFSRLSSTSRHTRRI